MQNDEAPSAIDERVAPTLQAGRGAGSLFAAFGVVVVVWAAIYVAGLGRIPFHTKGEPREALVVWEMVHGGSWVLPKRNGTELPSKPPMFHWLAAGLSKATGRTDEMTIRMPSALAALGGALLVTGAGHVLWGASAGGLAGLALLTMFEWLRSGTSARVDMVLTFGMTLALLAFLFFQRTRRWHFLLPLYAGLAVAMLGKGPVGVGLPAWIVVGAALLSRDLRVLRDLRPIRGLLFVAVCAGAWYFLAYTEGGEAFFRKQILDENLFRLVGHARHTGGHRHSNGYLFGALLLGLLPATFLLPAVLDGLRQRWRELSWKNGEIFCLWWAVAIVGFYCLPAGKRSVYLLPAYPPIALLIGWGWYEVSNRSRSLGAVSRWLLIIVALVGVVAFAILVSLVWLPMHDALDKALGGLISRPRDRAATLAVLDALRHSMAGSALAAVGAAAAIATGVLAWQRDRRAAFALIGVAASLHGLGRTVLQPAIGDAQTAKTLMSRIRSEISAVDPVFAYGSIDYGSVYYYGRHMPVHSGGLDAAGPRYLLMSRKQWERQRAAAVHRYRMAEAGGAPLDSPSMVLVERIEESSPPSVALP